MSANQRPRTERELHLELCLVDSRLHMMRLDAAEQECTAEHKKAAGLVATFELWRIQQASKP